jgi:hypothetical protein
MCWLSRPSIFASWEDQLSLWTRSPSWRKTITHEHLSHIVVCICICELAAVIIIVITAIAETLVQLLQIAWAFLSMCICFIHVPLCNVYYDIICSVCPQVTLRSRCRELGQEGICNRVRDRYEDEVAHTLAQPPQSSRCGRQLCKEHERSNMWYQRELI